MNINNTWEAANKLFYGIWGMCVCVRRRYAHWKRHRLWYVLFLSNDKVFVHRARRASFMPCAVLFCVVVVVVWSQIPLKRFQYIIKSMLLFGMLCGQTGNVLRMNLSRVRVVKSIMTDCLAGWLSEFIFSHLFCLLIQQKNKLFLKYKTTTHSQRQRAVFNIYIKCMVT